MVLSQIQAVQSVGRKTRRPQHTFYGTCKPYTIQPIVLAPVLPGETLKSAQLQARVVTDPIANPVMGWWQEYYFFYVKHRDLDDRVELEQMMLNPEWTKDNIDDPTADNSHYFASGGINWSVKCLKRVVEEYFRNEGEAWDNVTIDGMPVAAINNTTILQSAELADNVDDPSVVNEGGSAVHQASELDAAFRQWEYMRLNELTQMSYEDFLRTYGVRTSRIEQHRPELIRYIRVWQYPSSVIQPSDGLPSAAVSWAIQEKIDKDRFFTEPGFIFGVSVTRAKVYMAQHGYAAAYLDRAFDWMPAVLREDVYSSLKKYANGSGPARQVTDTDGYWVDMRDLFVHGDQFLFNATVQAMPTIFNGEGWGSNQVALPSAGLNVEYPSDADVKNLFQYANGSGPNIRWNVKQDGVLSLNILGTQQDHT